ncbi:MAG: PAS domain S-box protein [Calditrichaeota bacterium]|nr:MAG: PAS domain S-box protein [Calditrichota bacterium]MBL1207665.1 PAS domain S-box protein [Calditrichota bacterium]NOG47498.1 PAS domain S-box protein [Calditrichota bacterium]
MNYSKATKQNLIEEIETLRNELKHKNGNNRPRQTTAKEISQAQKIQKILFNISKATGEVGSLYDLLSVIHEQVGTLIECRNFYVALYNIENGEYSFPYYMDEFDLSGDFTQEEMRNSLTEYVRKKRTPLLIDSNTDKKMIEQGKIDLVGQHALIWMGVPFKINEQFSGVLVVQSYNKAESYTKHDLEIMTFVTEHISWAIERKKAEEALRISEESYRGLFNNASDAIYIQDSNGNFLDVNKTVEKMYGYKRDYLIGKSPAILSAPGKNDLEKVGHFIKEASKGKPQIFEFWGIRKNGEVFPKEVRLNQGIYFGQGAIIAFAQDITERKLSEKQLKQSELRFRTLIENSPVAIGMSRKGKILFANDAYLKLFGYKNKAEIIGSSILNHLAVSERKKLLALNQSREDNKKGPSSYESVGLRKDGSTFPFQINVTVIQLEEGTATLVFISDIHNLKKAEEERLNLERQILHTQKLESLGVLAGGIAHDFNNLLTGIMGNTGLAMVHAETSSPAQNNLLKIENIASRAAELCNQMLAYSGKGKFVIQPIDINEIVRDMALLLNVSIPKKVSLQVDLDPNLPAIEADVSQTRQVIMNLITNAADAIGKEAGVIKIKSYSKKFTGDELKSRYIEQELEGGFYIVLEVLDNGCGMKEETLNKLFDPFFTTKFTGRGLGLAAVLGIVRGHKGTLDIDSTFHIGTMVKIAFPASSKKALPLHTKKKRNEQLKGEGTIMVVDDEESVRSILKESLELSGFKIILAEDGEVALKKYKKYSDEIKLVVLDLTMPKLNGEETYKRLTKINPTVKVILSSGFNAQEAIKRFASNGIAGYLQKPYHLQSLRDKIIEVIGN